MRTPRYAVGAILAAATLAACQGTEPPTAPGTPDLRVEDAGHNAALHFSSITPVADTIENPCNGEIIPFSGTLTDQTTLVDKPEALPDNHVHGEHNGTISESGTGLTTGLPYELRISVHDQFESPSAPAANFVFTSLAVGRVTSPSPGLSFTIRFAFHGIGLPSGEFKATKDVESVECR